MRTLKAIVVEKTGRGHADSFENGRKETERKK
jgi:hypothetical protein